MLEDDRPSRKLNSVPPPPDDFVPGPIDWRGVAILALIFGFAGFICWLYR